MCEVLKSIISYSKLGYDITLTSLFGKDAIRMVKRYSYKTESPIICEQIYEHEALEGKHNEIFQFMYDDIQKQEESGELYKPLTEN